MGIGVSIFLIAVGAVLTFAVSASAEGVNLDVVGIILMAVGGIGLLVTLVMGAGRRESVVTEERRDVV